jgi:hypothetical protein
MVVKILNKIKFYRILKNENADLVSGIRIKRKISYIEGYLLYFILYF